MLQKIEKYFVNRFKKDLSRQVENMSYYIGVEKNDNPKLIENYESDRKLLEDLNKYLERTKYNQPKKEQYKCPDKKCTSVMK